MIVLFVASNPSRSSKTLDAMHISTRSRKTIDEWLNGKDIEARFINVCDEPTPNNRALSKLEILENIVSLKSKIDAIKPDRIVALGNTAAWALSFLGVSCFYAPHPSGRNRLWNSPEFKRSFKADLDKFLSV